MTTCTFERDVPRASELNRLQPSGAGHVLKGLLGLKGQCAQAIKFLLLATFDYLVMTCAISDVFRACYHRLTGDPGTVVERSAPPPLPLSRTFHSVAQLLCQAVDEGTPSD